ncbi:MAG: hypothetical protein NTY77_12410 [Elusimicrobia bacterium]|nr:hypothetical protein [Elusimicrobiota bacterium]
MDPENWFAYCAKRTNAELIAGLKRLDGRESRSLAAILAHLSELDDRMAVQELAFPSLFNYCTRELGYSEAEALLRIRTARAARRYPSILTMIAQRRIHVTAVAKLYPHLTSANYRSLLAKASRRSLEELDRLLAELAPLPEKRPVIRMLSVGDPAPALENGGPPKDPCGGAAAEDLFSAAASGEPAATLSQTEAPEQREGRVLFNFVAGEELLAKYKRAKGLLWHKYPAGRPEHIFDDALEALLDRKDPDRRIERKRRRAAAREAVRARAPCRRLSSPGRALSGSPIGSAT